MNFEDEIQKLKQRNILVEQNKAWETSWSRTIVLMCITFFTAYFFLKTSGIVNDSKVIILSALIPALAFLVSTLTLPPLKKLWEKWQ